MRIKILFLSFFFCCTYTSFAQKLWIYAKEKCMPSDLSQHTLLFPITPDPGLKYDYEKANKIFKKYYPYNYAFVTEDSLKSMDSLSNYYALRKEEVTRTLSTAKPGTYGYSQGTYGYTPGTGSYTSPYKTYKYIFTKGNSNSSSYESLDIYSTKRYKSLKIIVKNLFYDIPSNKPKHCFKINIVAPIPNYSRLGASYECLIHRKTSLGMYVEGGSWNYIINNHYLSSDFILFQPQLIRYFNLFKNYAYDGLFLGIAPFLFYNKDHLNLSDPDVTVSSQTITGYGIKGMIGYQCMIGKTLVIGAWGGPQYRFNAKDNYLYENYFLTSNYRPIAFTGQVFAGFVLK